MDFLPSRQADMLAWSSTFDGLINANFALYGLTLDQATAYNALHTAFADLYALTRSNETRTPAKIIAKDQALKALKAEARRLAKIIQAYPGTTDEMRSNLGLTVPDVEPSPEPRPTVAPRVDIVDAFDHTVTVRLHDPANPNKRGKPDAVKGAGILAFVGQIPPSPGNIAAWEFKGNTSRTKFNVVFPFDIPSGTTVWVTAFWFNDKMQSGPASAPVSAQIPGTYTDAA